MKDLMNLVGIAYEAANDKGAGGEPDVAKPADAKGEFRQLAAEIRETVKTYGTDNAEAKERLEKLDKRASAIEDSLFDLKKRAMSQPAVNGNTGRKYTDEFRNIFTKWAKNDRQSLAKDYDVKSGYHPLTETKSDNLVRFDVESAGALLLPAEMSLEMIRNVQEVSPIMQLATTSTTSAPQKIRTIRDETPGITWLAEDTAGTKSKIKYRNVTLTPQKAAARYGFSIEMFQDSAWDLPSEIMQAWSEDFDVGANRAFVNGNGVGKPKGFLDAAKEYDPGNRTLLASELIELQAQILDSYARNGSWLFNRLTRAYIRAIMLASEAHQHLWEPDFTRQHPTLLLGNPVYIAGENDLHGVVSGNFDDNSKPIVFGDFKRGYEVCVHTDMYVINDMYSESSSFVTNVNIMSRIDGQPLDAAKALVAMKKSA